ncbi:hypothetical protein AB0M02_31275 [Actinoplanes sp. NPDC051861]|uniref:hypothetical protein n=1 Tax=Actinoplanes sp. NPDC051861 TaxID=3155170 RepID=UPI003434F65F
MIRSWWAERRGRDQIPTAGLEHLLDAIQAPATAQELRGEQAFAAALAAERRRAAAFAQRRHRKRTVVAGAVAAVAILAASGTGVAARTGNLPPDVQQGAHQLFSGLGVPAPRSSTSRPVTPPPTAAPTLSPTPTPSRAEWCSAWRTANEGGKPMNGRERRDLVAAAGGAAEVAKYCGPVSPSATAKPTRPGKSAKPEKSKKAPPGQGK